MLARSLPRSRGRGGAEQGGGQLSLAEANASRRLNADLGYVPGLLRKQEEYGDPAAPPEALPDPMAWMHSARVAREASASAAAAEAQKRLGGRARTVRRHLRGEGR